MSWKIYLHLLSRPQKSKFFEAYVAHTRIVDYQKDMRRKGVHMCQCYLLSVFSCFFQRLMSLLLKSYQGKDRGMNSPCQSSPYQ
jgi:hypothetical protein